ncbi:MTAP family purine nucleoside phosphorylase [Candidatus Woesearchaeota archaeon]|nr:MTAP family purine nucleoside phosphorylase [Candidatus Woesearchaeota archaeon]
MELGIIGGSGLFEKRLLKSAKKKKVKTPYGTVAVFVKDDVCFIQRHGDRKDIPPHKINHHANINAFMRLGVEDIIGISSVGSLKKAIKPGSIVVIHDYMSFHSIPTFFNDSIIHTTPGLSAELRKKLIDTARKAKVKTVNKGVYLQTHGPRLETKAEIRMFKNYADVVGMTIANEATLAKELELNYAAICSVDNYANGIVPQQLDFEEVKGEQKKNFRKIKSIIEHIIK